MPAEAFILRECKESHHRSCSDCLTRSSISDTQPCQPEQSLFSLRKPSLQMAPRRLDGEVWAIREGCLVPVPGGFISCTDRSPLFRWADGFSTSWSPVPANRGKRECYFNGLWQVISGVCFKLAGQLERKLSYCIRSPISMQNALTTLTLMREPHWPYLIMVI